MAWPRAVVHPSRGAPASRPDCAPPHANTVYILQASQALPSIDCVTTVKTVLLRNPHHLRVFNQFARRIRRVSSASLAFGCVLSIAFSFVENVETERVLSVASTALLIGPLSLGFMVMRVDILRLLIKTYEFWFIMLNSTTSTVLLCIYFQDVARLILPIATLASYMSAFLVDASCSDARATTFSLAVGAATVSLFMAAVAFKMMPTTRSIVLFTANGHVLESEDVILNSLGIVLLLLSRNAYRKYTTRPRRRMDASAARVRLIGYRVRIQFVEVDPRSTPNTTLQPVQVDPIHLDTRPVQSTNGTPETKRSQLAFVAPATRFHARGVLWPAVFDALSVTSGTLPVYILSRSSLVLVVAAWIASDTQELCIAALVVSTVYRALSLALSNRAMLWLLLRSFDVQFQLVQHALAHLAAAYTVRDDRRLFLLTSWSWFSWLVTIDALTPAAKRQLCISREFLLAVFVVMIVAQAAYCAAFVYFPFENPTLFTLSVTKQHSVTVKAIPFFLTRLLSMFWWIWRLLWRVYTQDVSELVVIQGGVEYDDHELHRKLLKRATKRHRTQQALRTASQQVVAWMATK